MLAQAVERLVPLAVAPNGAITLGYDPLDDTFAQAVEKSRGDVLTAVKAVFEGLTAIRLTPHTPTATAPSRDTTTRMTADDVQRQRTEQMASRHALLGAAVKALDLELLD